MARNGSGTASLLNTVAPPGQVNNPTNINATMTDIASMLTDSINKDGTKPFAANQPMAGFKLTGSGVGSATTDLARIDQTQINILQHATTVGGTVDAITLAFTPTLAAFPAKSRIRWTSAGVNTTTTPTITADGFGPYTVKKGALAALAASDLGASGQINEGVFDGTQILLVSSIPLTNVAKTNTQNLFTKAQEFAKGAAVASAASMDIWTPADGNTVHGTGTATVTSFATAPQAGAWRWIIADAAFVLTNNANILVQGAANYTCAVGDRLFVYADTTTVCYVIIFPASGKAVAATILVSATASGTTLDITGIPSWANEITVSYNGITKSGTDGYNLQLGSGSIQATGYASTISSINAASASCAAGGATNFQVATSGTVATAFSGSSVLTRAPGTNTWVLGCSVAGVSNWCTYTAGAVTLGGVLDRVRLSMTGANTFTGGTYSVFVKG